MERFAHFESASQSRLRLQAALLDQLHIRQRAAISNRRLVRVHFHHSVIDTHSVQRGEDMLNRVNLDVPFSDRGSAFDELQILNFRINCGFVWQVSPFEFDAVIDRRRLQGQCNQRAGV
jgi:hypothetical protein